ncbi:hypothetical protein [Oceanicola sp. 502str15]|uniref:COG4315 family predicted lipoprotein n=1 Tax=Oceanicola sp. 502str15 TaxID=2696061 RepID=UPI0020948DF7|nr:hypothetical protein [Oceanicola sp. 502str15]MCO6383965.1 hypothetical protein [Oceanicola sp. 502str15]
MTRTFLIAALFASTATFAMADAHGGAPVQEATLDGAAYLTDANGMTLYTFDKDASGPSVCYDACADSWPPLVVDAGMALPEGYALSERKDGAVQVTWNGEPLYFWAGDSEPGDMTGDGVGGVWHVARP